MKSIFRITEVILIILSIFFIHSCKKDKPKSPVLTTNDVSEITQTTATSGGNITNDEGASVTVRGVCWGTTTGPTTANSKTTDGSGIGSFTSNLTGLTASTKYFVRAYATNSAGIGYGSILSFTTQDSSILFNPNLTYGMVNDIDGTVYKTITIGTQVWMAENLKTNKYRNGDLIGTTTPATLDISPESTPKYQWAYDGNVSKVAIYGRLYTWYAVTDSRNLCPTGWHLPTDTEWTTMTTYLGGESVAGGKLKETGTIHWLSPNTEATNKSGFTALPGGYRNSNGYFNYRGGGGNWWSATESDALNATAWRRSLDYGTSDVDRYGYPKEFGFSVRCVKDN